MGGRKKKLNARTATSDVTIATQQARRCGGHKDDDQERHRNRRRIRYVKPPYIDEGDGSNAEEAESQPGPVAITARHWPAS